MDKLEETVGRVKILAQTHELSLDTGAWIQLPDLYVILAALEVRTEALRPLAELARKFSTTTVVEVCEPHPRNPSAHIEPLFTSQLLAAASALEKP